MTYALRKLIAFVFLLGIFWYVYRDLDNLWDASFQRSVALLVILFALIWGLVPLAVVQVRIRKRNTRNQAGYERWRAALPAEGPRPLTGVGSRITLAPGEKAYWIEKGTLYLPVGTELESFAISDSPGEVAFPGCRRFKRKIQRVRFCLTDRRLVFVGKDFSFEWSRAAVRLHPGGIVLRRLDGDGRSEVAFTCQNPLIVGNGLFPVTEKCYNSHHD